MNDLETINRMAVVLLPSQAYLDWTRTCPSIATDDGQQWNVHPGYLSPAGTKIVELPGGRHG